MNHSHYSPYQFATAEQTAEPKKQVVAEKKQLLSVNQARHTKTRNLGSTMPHSMAMSASSTPNAFISPNAPDAMRQIKAVFGSL